PRVCLLLLLRPPPLPTLFPYTTLFRSSTAGISSAPGGARRVVRGVSATTPSAPPDGSDPPQHPGEAAGARRAAVGVEALVLEGADRKSTRLNSSHVSISYAVFCLKKKK